MIETQANVSIISENRRLIYNKHKTRLINNPLYAQYKTMLGYGFHSYLNFKEPKMLKKNICAEMEIHTCKDLDNIIKGILDVCQSLGYIKNDREVIEIRAKKVKIKRGHQELIKVKLFENY